MIDSNIKTLSNDINHKYVFCSMMVDSNIKTLPNHMNHNDASLECLSECIYFHDINVECLVLFCVKYLHT